MSAERCVACDELASLVRERVSFPIGNRFAEIEVERYRCTSCDEVFFSPQQARSAQTIAANELRRQDGLLGPAEIKAIRVRYELTQAQLERLLAVGPKTVVRWERGTVCQNKATDMLLRVMRDVPAAFRFLAQQNKVDVTIEESCANPINEPVAKVSFTTRQGSAKSKPKVVSFHEFSKRTPQVRPVVVTEELALPDIPQEALK